jgi:hypothetical protein
LNFYKLAVAAIKCAMQIVKLDIGDNVPLLNLLIKTPLPSLCKYALPYVVNIGSFLQNYAVVENLVIYPPERYFDTGDLGNPLEFPLVQLPNLVSFMGPATIVSRMLLGSVICNATLLWGIECDFEKI